MRTQTLGVGADRIGEWLTLGTWETYMSLPSLYFSPSLQVGLVVLLTNGLGLSAGCEGTSDITARLSGEVTLDDQPLPANALASVSFQPIKVGEARATSAQIVDSRYDCPNVPKGKVLAYLNISIPTGRTYRTGPNGKDESELENIALTAEEADGIEVDVAGDDTVNFGLHRAKR